MKNATPVSTLCPHFAFLAIPFIFSACMHGTEPEKPGIIGSKLYWTSGYECREGNLFGVYRGNLKVSGLTIGDKIKVFYGKTLISDTVAGNNELEFSNLESSDASINLVSILYRDDTLQLFSEDSLLDTQTPFPVRFDVIATNPSLNESTKRFSLLASDSGAPRIRCQKMANNVGFSIQPDTLKYDAKAIHIIMWADTYAGYYHIWTDYLDTTNITRRLYLYDVIYGPAHTEILPKLAKGSEQTQPKLTLQRGSFGFTSTIPNLPAQVTVSLGFPEYFIRIEKE